MVDGAGIRPGSNQIDPGLCKDPGLRRQSNIYKDGVMRLPIALTLRRSQKSNSETGWLVGSEIDEEARGEREEA